MYTKLNIFLIFKFLHQLLNNVATLLLQFDHPFYQWPDHPFDQSPDNPFYQWPDHQFDQLLDQSPHLSTLRLTDSSLDLSCKLNLNNSEPNELKRSSNVDVNDSIDIGMESSLNHIELDESELQLSPINPSRLVSVIQHANLSPQPAGISKQINNARKIISNNKIEFLYTNATSLVNKWDEFMATLATLSFPHVLMITETWFNLNSITYIENYTSYIKTEKR